MKQALSIENIPFDKNSILTVGTFDGVHSAHQAIISKVVHDAKSRNGRSVVVTFDPHPREVLSPNNTERMLLTTLQERIEICNQLGVDWIVIIEFTRDFSQINFRDFYLKYLISGIGISEVVEGYDHHWGKNREGNINALLSLGKEHGFDVVQVEEFKKNGVLINSSMIRHELMDGAVENVETFLGRSYSLSGKVVKGDQRGQLLGYPTANIEPASAKKMLPKDGIYFVKVLIEKESHFGMASIGIRPTFYNNGERVIEVYILDFKRNLYDCTIRIEFLRRLRDELKFDSSEQLIRQMHLDKETSLKLQHEYTKNIIHS